tara:strand:- start:230 stop:484 length:255 start_codon:yes stop_codon:yes gene_type:complete
MYEITVFTNYKSFAQLVIYKKTGKMNKSNVIISCEVIINYALKRLSKLDGKNKLALENEYKEWINALGSDEKHYEVLHINKIDF